MQVIQNEKLAEREGFEPPIPVKVWPLSRRLVSRLTTLFIIFLRTKKTQNNAKFSRLALPLLRPPGSCHSVSLLFSTSSMGPSPKYFSPYSKSGPPAQYSLSMKQSVAVPPPSPLANAVALIPPPRPDSRPRFPGVAEVHEWIDMSEDFVVPMRLASAYPSCTGIRKMDAPGAARFLGNS